MTWASLWTTLLLGRELFVRFLSPFSDVSFYTFHFYLGISTTEHRRTSPVLASCALAAADLTTIQ
jgi:hypothetical protein